MRYLIYFKYKDTANKWVEDNDIITIDNVSDLVLDDIKRFLMGEWTEVIIMNMIKLE